MYDVDKVQGLSVASRTIYAHSQVTWRRVTCVILSKQGGRPYRISFHSRSKRPRPPQRRRWPPTLSSEGQHEHEDMERKCSQGIDVRIGYIYALKFPEAP